MSPDVEITDVEISVLDVMNTKTMYIWRPISIEIIMTEILNVEIIIIAIVNIEIADAEIIMIEVMNVETALRSL